MEKAQNISEKGRNIARNTALLYVRMFIMLIVGLYTSRVVLNALGQDDLGIYGTVGGVVALFAVLTGAVASAISRFLAFELGKADSRMKEVFSSTVFVQIVLAVVVVILAEIAGWWFIHHKMVIPDGRTAASVWVLHSSVLIFAVNMLSVPYNAAIIAHEKMNAFAYISILEALLALGAALATRYTPHDKLVVYSVLMLGVALVVRLIYGLYARRTFPECRFRPGSVDRGVIKEIGSFTSWAFLGSAAGVLNSQGINVLMNLFFGVRVNAARDVTAKLEGNMSRFVNNITTAINPQLNKSFASGDMPYMHTLICKGAKYTYFLYFFFAFPIILEAPALLKLWLVNVPLHAVNFVRISLITMLFVSVGTPFVNAIMASGTIRRYEIIASITNVSAFPLSYIAFKLGCPPELAYCFVTLTALCVLAERIVIACRLTKMPSRMVLGDVFGRIIAVSAAAAAVPAAVFFLAGPSLLRMVVLVLLSFVCTALSAFFIGTTPGERAAIIETIKTKIKKI